MAKLLFIITCIIWIFSACNKSGISEKHSSAAGPDFPAFARINDGSEVIDVIDLNGPWKFKATDEAEWMDAMYNP